MGNNKIWTVVEFAAHIFTIGASACTLAGLGHAIVMNKKQAAIEAAPAQPVVPAQPQPAAPVQEPGMPPVA